MERHNFLSVVNSLLLELSGFMCARVFLGRNLKRFDILEGLCTVSKVKTRNIAVTRSGSSFIILHLVEFWFFRIRFMHCTNHSIWAFSLKSVVLAALYSYDPDRTWKRGLQKMSESSKSVVSTHEELFPTILEYETKSCLLI